jgi:hypothetical protein
MNLFGMRMIAIVIAQALTLINAQCPMLNAQKRAA